MYPHAPKTAIRLRHPLHPLELIESNRAVEVGIRKLKYIHEFPELTKPHHEYLKTAVIAEIEETPPNERYHPPIELFSFDASHTRATLTSAQPSHFSVRCEVGRGTQQLGRLVRQKRKLLAAKSGKAKTSKPSQPAATSAPVVSNLVTIKQAPATGGADGSTSGIASRATMDRISICPVQNASESFIIGASIIAHFEFGADRGNVITSDNIMKHVVQRYSSATTPRPGVLGMRNDNFAMPPRWKESIWQSVLGPQIGAKAWRAGPPSHAIVKGYFFKRIGDVIEETPPIAGRIASIQRGKKTLPKQSGKCAKARTPRGSDWYDLGSDDAHKILNGRARGTVPVRMHRFLVMPDRFQKFDFWPHRGCPQTLNRDQRKIRMVKGKPEKRTAKDLFYETGRCHREPVQHDDPEESAPPFIIYKTRGGEVVGVGNDRATAEKLIHGKPEGSRAIKAEQGGVFALEPPAEGATFDEKSYHSVQTWRANHSPDSVLMFLDSAMKPPFVVFKPATKKPKGPVICVTQTVNDARVIVQARKTEGYTWQPQGRGSFAVHPNPGTAAYKAVKKTKFEKVLRWRNRHAPGSEIIFIPKPEALVKTIHEGEKCQVCPACGQRHPQRPAELLVRLKHEELTYTGEDGEQIDKPIPGHRDDSGLLQLRALRNALQSAMKIGMHLNANQRELLQKRFGDLSDAAMAVVQQQQDLGPVLSMKPQDLAYLRDGLVFTVHEHTTKDFDRFRATVVEAMHKVQHLFSQLEQQRISKVWAEGFEAARQFIAAHPKATVKKLRIGMEKVKEVRRALIENLVERGVPWNREQKRSKP